jgi:dienelactone hydrolase
LSPLLGNRLLALVTQAFANPRLVPYIALMQRLISLVAILFSSAGPLLADPPARAPLPPTTPWKMDELSKPPAVEWLDEKSPVRTLMYAGEPFAGKPSRVFAVYASPATIDENSDPKGPWPGIVLIHGGGGSAFPEWVALWAKRGYAAIAMDLAGNRPDLNAPHNPKKRTRLEDGGPEQGHEAKFPTINTDDLTDDWPYHAVANCIRAHSLLRTLPGVDPDRTAVTGISWGGYTTCIVASVDSRFKAAVPVYGCGFLHHNSTWLDEFEKLGPEQTRRWAQLYDPSAYLPSCGVPMFFVNGTNDFAYPLDSYMKSYAATPSAANLRLEVKMPHGHPQGWAPPEIGAFIDSHLLGKSKLPRMTSPVPDGYGAIAQVQGAEIVSATIEFTIGREPINALEWQSIPADIAKGSNSSTVSAPLPRDARLFFFTGKTADGMMISSPVTIRP